MASSTNTPTTVQVPETPIQTPLIDKGGISTKWLKWLSILGTWVMNAQEVKQITDTNGVNYMTRIGNMVTVSGSLVPGTYTGTTVASMNIPPVIQSVVAFSNGAMGIIGTDGNLSVTTTSTSTLYFTATYIAGKE